jgi:phosphate binding protein
MKNFRKTVALVVSILVIVATLGACGKTDNNSTGTNDTNNTSNNSDTKDLSGTVTMSGSTSMEKLANAAAEAFMTKYPSVTVTAEFTGSGAGIEAVTAGTVNIGNSSRKLTDEEKSAGVVENIVAIDGIGVIVDKANTVKNLTKDQLSKVYKGEVKNWKDLGGADKPIVVVGREAGSGTRDAFEELVGIKDAAKYSNEINSTGGVLAKVAQTAGAIGYVSLDVIDQSVNTVSLDGVQPTEENVKAGTYLLNRPFVMATKGEVSAQNKEVKAFIDWMLSAEGQDLVKQVGLITVNK